VALTFLANVGSWPVATDIAAQADVGVQGNSGRRCGVLQTTKMTHLRHDGGEARRPKIALGDLCRAVSSLVFRLPS
jgi:hypothetical protein